MTPTPCEADERSVFDQRARTVNLIADPGTMCSARLAFDGEYLEVDAPEELFDHSDELKEWIWKNHKDKILSSISVKRDREKTKLEQAQRRLRLLDNIALVQRQHLQMEEKSIVFGTLLGGLLDIMESEYGFIGEVKLEEDGRPYLQTHAVTNIAWNAATSAFYEENKDFGLKFYNMQTLFGHCILTSTPIIANDAPNDRRGGGVPEGHPPLNHFLGIPFFEAGGTQMTGMVGLANKAGGYSAADIEFLEPFTMTCSNLIQAYNAIRENEYLINTLEETVTERTRELQLANQSLELANRQVMKASAAQLEHFACMSHEIRTPLNCIIGLSSLLQETDMNPYQEDSLKMIVTSGDLLLTVVNDVLDYSKLESGNVDINIQQSNLQETLDAVVHSFVQKSRSKNLEVKTFYDAMVPEFVNTDSKRLQQILYNLLGNAMKFSHEGGAVELHVELLRREVDDENSIQELDIDVLIETEVTQQIDKSEAKPEEETATDEVAVMKPEYDSDPNLLENSADNNAVASKPRPSRCPFRRSEEDLTHPVGPSRSPSSKTHEESSISSMESQVHPDKSPLIVRIPKSELRQAEDIHHSRRSSLRLANQKDSFRGPTIDEADDTSKSIISSDSIGGTLNTDSLYPSTKRQRLLSSATTATEHETESMPRCGFKYSSLQKEDLSCWQGLDIVLRFSVKDYGTGIKKGDFNRIFQPFKQANSDTERLYGGTGLGLAITTKLVKGLGGSIAVDSVEGEWSKFSIDLPFDTSPANMDSLFKSISSATVLKVTNDCEEQRAIEKNLFDTSMVDSIAFKNMDELDAYVRNRHRHFDQDRVYICLVNEDLYHPEAYKALCQRATKSILLTFGPKYSVQETNCHYRSLAQILPSVLIKSLAAHITGLETRDSSIRLRRDVLAAVATDTVIQYGDLRILVAEDNVINQKVLVRMLAKLGVQNVDVVDNGQKAVDQEAQKDYDIVYMDMQMPVMDGTEACRRIVKRRRGADVSTPKVVFVTANVSGGFESETAQAGGNGFISKPFKVHEIENSFKLVLAPI
jgi:signal transduction histidine kinase/CheY-like chemotaxis protein